MTTKSRQHIQSLEQQIERTETALAEAIESSDALQHHIDVLLRHVLRSRYQMVQRVAAELFGFISNQSEAIHERHAPSVQSRGR
jgi:hypothetical protein